MKDFVYHHSRIDFRKLDYRAIWVEFMIFIELTEWESQERYKEDKNIFQRINI